jgi:hypothetical protein
LLQGAIIHVEHLERPNHLPRENIESYRIPSIIDFARVRLHVGSSAPTTYFVGRAVKDSGNFEEDFLKVSINTYSISTYEIIACIPCILGNVNLTAFIYIYNYQGNKPQK